jgi:hypothetical protein
VGHLSTDKGPESPQCGRGLQIEVNGVHVSSHDSRGETMPANIARMGADSDVTLFPCGTYGSFIEIAGIEPSDTLLLLQYPRRGIAESYHAKRLRPLPTSSVS